MTDVPCTLGTITGSEPTIGTVLCEITMPCGFTVSIRAVSPTACQLSVIVPPTLAVGADAVNVIISKPSTVGVGGVTLLDSVAVGAGDVAVVATVAVSDGVNVTVGVLVAVGVALLVGVGLSVGDGVVLGVSVAVGV